MHWWEKSEARWAFFVNAEGEKEDPAVIAGVNPGFWERGFNEMGPEKAAPQQGVQGASSLGKFLDFKPSEMRFQPF